LFGVFDLVSNAKAKDADLNLSKPGAVKAIEVKRLREPHPQNPSDPSVKSSD
jgi:hypothetical protein